MRRLPTAAGLLFLLASPGVAQDAAVLGGWALPEGAVIESVVATATQAVAQQGGLTFDTESGSFERMVSHIDRVEDGRLMRSVRRVTAVSSKAVVDGTAMPPDPAPLLGRDVAVTRTGDGWAQEPVGWTPDADARAALDEPISLGDPQYPTRPVAVGETVEVADAVIRDIYPSAIEGPHRLTVRLDSLGTVDGAPVAYLTQDVDVTVALDQGTMRMDMVARIVRRLDWMLDVETEWTGPVSFAFGPVTMEGTMTFISTQTARLPGEADG